MKSNLQLLSLFWQFLRSQKLKLILVALILPFSSFSYSVQPLILQKAIDGPLMTKDLDGLWFYTGLFLAAIILNFFIQVFQFWYVNSIGQNLVADIREKLFIHIENLSLSYFDKTPVGRTVSRLTSDVEQLAESFSFGLILIILDFFNILGILAFMFYLNWQLSIVVFTFLVPIYFFSVHYQNRFREASLMARKELSKLNSFLQQNVVGISVVQVLNSVGKSIEKFAKNNQKYFKANDESIRADSQLSAIIEFISLFATGLLILLSAYLLDIKTTALSIGVILAFIQYTQSLFEPIKNLTGSFTVVQSAFTSLERIQEAFDEKAKVTDPAKPQNISKDASTNFIEFKNVSFKYLDKGDWVLKNFNLVIENNKKTAIVGRTGSGKSTLIKLLTRLYDVNEGEILLNGINIKDYKQSELRKAIAVIHQDSYIFAGGLHDNIVLGRDAKDLDLDYVEPLLNLTSIDEETNLSERAANISSGETQVINFARALVGHPQVLVLDEATAKIDVKTEEKIQEKLFDFLSDKTGIVIAHRLETIKNCDVIVYVESGRVIEKGSHQELLALEGKYKGLYEKFS